MGCANSVLASVCIALLCRFVFRLFMCLLMQHDNRWRHVSFLWDVRKVHVGDMFCLRMCYFGSSLRIFQI